MMSFEVGQIFIILLAVMLVTAFHRDWTVTEVGERWIGASSVQQEQIKFSSYGDRWTRFYMARACGARDWCRTACNMGNGGLLLLNLISAARNKDPSGPPLMKCLTNGRRNNIVTAQSGITVYDASQIYPTLLIRKPENLLDGVYDYNMDSCYLANEVEKPFVVFDLNSVRTVSTVSLMAQPKGLLDVHFHDMDVRLGMIGASGNFSSYTRLGYLSGPAPYFNFEYHIDVEVPITGRFLSVQVNSNESKLQVCHFELY